MGEMRMGGKDPSAKIQDPERIQISNSNQAASSMQPQAEKVGPCSRRMVEDPRSQIQDPEKIQIPRSNRALVPKHLALAAWSFPGSWILDLGSSFRRRLGALLLTFALAGSLCSSAQTIGNHPARYDERGILQPWTAWRDALAREVNWYLQCPWTNGYPRFVVMTFMDGGYNARQDRPDSIPAMQNGMGIISYLKYHAWSGRKQPRLIDIARSMGDFLVKENLTPNEGKYPRFPRS